MKVYDAILELRDIFYEHGDLDLNRSIPDEEIQRIFVEDGRAKISTISEGESEDV